MKSIKCFILFLLMYFISSNFVYASCTNEEISMLKEKAEAIKVTYKHKGIIETDERTLYNQFDVTIKNLFNEFYVTLLGESVKLEPVDGIATIELNNGKWLFKVHSYKCDVIIDEIDVFLPTFNIYSLDPLCEGIDGDDFPLCGKYYEYSVSYDKFEQKVNNYRKLHDDIYIQNEEHNINELLNYFFKYRYYIVGFLFAFLLIMLLFIILNKRKRRGVLE